MEGLQHEQAAEAEAPGVGVGGHGAEAVLPGMGQFRRMGGEEGANAEELLVVESAEVEGTGIEVGIGYAELRFRDMRPEHEVAQGPGLFGGDRFNRRHR